MKRYKIALVLVAIFAASLLSLHLLAILRSPVQPVSFVEEGTFCWTRPVWPGSYCVIEVKVNGNATHLAITGVDINSVRVDVWSCWPEPGDGSCFLEGYFPLPLFSNQTVSFSVASGSLKEGDHVQIIVHTSDGSSISTTVTAKAPPAQ